MSFYKITNFEFNGRIRQKIGIPMGAPISPSLTDLRMFEIVTEILVRYRHCHKIISLSMYRDGGFIIFNSYEQEQIQFFEIAITVHI